MDDVILVVPQCYLRATQLLGDIEELLTALPGTEKTGRFGALNIGRCVFGVFRSCSRLRKFCYDNMEWDATFVTEMLQITGVRLVAYVLHTYVECLDREMGYQDFGATSQKF